MTGEMCHGQSVGLWSDSNEFSVCLFCLSDTLALRARRTSWARPTLLSGRWLDRWAVAQKRRWGE